MILASRKFVCTPATVNKTVNRAISIMLKSGNSLVKRIEAIHGWESIPEQ